MNKYILTVITLVLIVLSAFYFTKNLAHTSESAQTDISTWKTYQDPELGFSIKYPAHYVAEVEIIATDTPWGSRSFLTLSDPSDTSLNEFDMPSVHITLQRQPVVASGKIYHTIFDYQQSGVADQMVQGSPDLGKLVSVNGMQALTYYFPAGDAGNGSSDAYFFIEDDLIYQATFKADDPYKEAILQSIAWQ